MSDDLTAKPPLVLPLQSEPRVTLGDQPFYSPLNLYVWGDSSITVCELIGGQEVWRSWCPEAYDRQWELEGPQHEPLYVEGVPIFPDNPPRFGR